MKAQSDRSKFVITEKPSEEEMKEYQEGLEAYNMSKTNGEFNSPQPWINLVLKDHEGTVVGGVLTSCLYWTHYLEVLWIDEKYRGLGYGRDLIMEAHRLGKEQGCISSHTYTFSWQAPDFYQAVGYDLIAIYDGYHSGITELILMTRFDTNHEEPSQKRDSQRFSISENPTQEEQSIVRKGLGSNFEKNANQVLKEYPQTGYKLVLKDEESQVIGGINGYTIMGTMFIEGLWIEEKHRGQGYGKKLLRRAEEMAQNRGCIAVQGACFTFQNLEFFKKLGYSFYGHTDAYPNDVKEYFLIKKF